MLEDLFDNHGGGEVCKTDYHRPGDVFGVHGSKGVDKTDDHRLRDMRDDHRGRGGHEIDDHGGLEVNQAPQTNPTAGRNGPRKRGDWRDQGTPETEMGERTGKKERTPQLCQCLA